MFMNVSGAISRSSLYLYIFTLKRRFSCLQGEATENVREFHATTPMPIVHLHCLHVTAEASQPNKKFVMHLKHLLKITRYCLELCAQSCVSASM